MSGLPAGLLSHISDLIKRRPTLASRIRTLAPCEDSTIPSMSQQPVPSEHPSVAKTAKDFLGHTGVALLERHHGVFLLS